MTTAWETRRYLVTGASSGIGQRLAQRLLHNGAHVVLVGRNRDALETTATGFESQRVTIMPADLKDPQQAESLASTLEQALDGIVHCAGVDQKKPAHLMKAAQVHEQLEVNALSLLWIATTLHGRKLLSPCCSIVALSSVLAQRSVLGAVGYSLSKSALEAMVRSLALEWAPQKARVNCVRAGTVDSPMTEKLFSRIGESGREAIVSRHPLGLGSLDDIVDAVLFLLSDQSRWITGTSLTVDGGYSIL